MVRALFVVGAEKVWYDGVVIRHNKKTFSTTFDDKRSPSGKSTWQLTAFHTWTCVSFAPTVAYLSLLPKALFEDYAAWTTKRTYKEAYAAFEAIGVKLPIKTLDDGLWHALWECIRLARRKIATRKLVEGENIKSKRQRI